ncbi:MAG: HAD family hydrolase [Pseudomonadota bacterium]
MPIRMVALDIDGTLLSPSAAHTDLPSPEIVAAVAALQSAGVIVVLATGRMYPGTAPVARHLNISEPLVCQQGAAVHNLDGTLRERHPLPIEVAAELVDYAAEHRLDYAWFNSERYLVTRESPETSYFTAVSGVTAEVHPAPQNTEVAPMGFDLIASPERSREIFAELSARYAGRVNLLGFNTVTAVHSLESSKAKALARIATSRGIAAGEVLAIGDSINDVSMLRWAGIGAAPSHCDDNARDAADELLAEPGVAGVAARLRMAAAAA